VKFFVDNTPLMEEEIRREVRRYLTCQACAYKVGELKIKELRQKAEQALGRPKCLDVQLR